MLKPYSELVKIDVLPYCEHRKAKDDSGKTIEVPYLNWAKCKELLHENGAETVYYEPVLNKNGHSLFMSDIPFTNDKNQTNRCYEVRVRTVIDDKEYFYTYPLLNGTYVVRDDNISQLRVSNAQARAFVKCVAIHTGLGFGLWVKNDETTAATVDDLSIHSSLAIYQRVGQTMTRLIQSGMDEKIIFERIGTTKKAFDLMLRAHQALPEYEKKLNKL